MNFTEEAQTLLKNCGFWTPKSGKQIVDEIAAALEATDKAAYERGRKEEREQNTRILSDPCVQKLRSDEPFFVLLGRDPDAREALEKWVRCRWQREGATDKVISAEMTLSDFIVYQRNHP